MSIVAIAGGLGNQVFQYIFARYLEETTNTRVFIDDMYYFLHEDEIKYNIENAPEDYEEKTTHNGYEIEYAFPFITKPQLLSEYFDPDVWQYMKNEIKKTPYQKLGTLRHLLYNGLDLSLLMETGSSDDLTGIDCTAYKTPANQYNSNVINLPGDVYYYGDWLNKGWFNRYRDSFLNEFSFREITDEKNKSYEKEIRNNLSVGVHIRRGDFVRLNFALPISYFHDNLKQLYHPDAVYFVFSDDQKWCKENRTELGLPDKQTVFVEGNYDYKNNYIDMQLMSMCNVLVEGNSSFSHLAGLLNQTPEFKSIRLRPMPEDDLACDLQRIL